MTHETVNIDTQSDARVFKCPHEQQVLQAAFVL